MTTKIGTPTHPLPSDVDHLLPPDLQTRLCSFIPSRRSDVHSIFTCDPELMHRLQFDSLLQPYAQHAKALTHLHPNALKTRVKEFCLSEKPDQTQAKRFFITNLFQLYREGKYAELQQAFSDLDHPPIVEQAIALIEDIKQIRENETDSHEDKVDAWTNILERLKLDSPELSLYIQYAGISPFFDSHPSAALTSHFIESIHSFILNLPALSEETSACLEHILDQAGKIAVQQKDPPNIKYLHAVLDIFLEKWKATSHSKKPTHLEQSLLKANALFKAYKRTLNRFKMPIEDLLFFIGFLVSISIAAAVGIIIDANIIFIALGTLLAASPFYFTMFWLGPTRGKSLIGKYYERRLLNHWPDLPKDQ